MTAVRLQLALGLVVELVPDGGELRVVAGDQVVPIHAGDPVGSIGQALQAIADQLGQRVAAKVDESIAVLARAESDLAAIATGNRRADRHVENLSERLRHVREVLRPIGVELWGGATRRRMDAQLEDGQRAAAAKPATIEQPGRLPRGRR